MRELSYEFLKEYYLMHQVYGCSKELNKKYFPKDYEEMKKELDSMKGQTNE